MKRRLILIGTALAALATAAPLALHAQPIEGPLRIVVGYAPGGSSDRVARIVGDKLQAKLGSPVIVENKTGAGGRLGVVECAHQLPHRCQWRADAGQPGRHGGGAAGVQGQRL